MQFPAAAKPPVGIVFDSAMARPDDVLALAMLHGFQGAGQARIAAIAVSSGDLRAARFCDAVNRFYASATTGAAAMFRRFPPIGLAQASPAGESRMFSGPDLSSAVKSINDTADPATLIRNALTAQYDQNAAVVLSGPPADLIQLLALQGAKELIARKVRLLCMTDRATPIPGWPTPVVTVGREIGEALRYPADSIEKDFAYANPHPIAEAYAAYQPMPYDAPSWAMAAMLYAVRPGDGYFGVTDSKLVLDPEQKDRIIRTYVEMASAKPVPRKPPPRPAQPIANR